MKKDIEWLKEKVDDLQIYSNPDVPKDRNDLYTQYVEGVNDAVRQVKGLVGELDDPEVLSREENVNIVLDDLKEYIKEQQTLSQNVGMAHTPAGNDTYYRQYDYVLECINEYEPSDDLQNLLVPKQELPVIPKYIADWIEEHNWKLENWKLPSAFRSDVKYKKDQRLYEWANKKGNMDIFMKALFGYEVEEEPEPKYVIDLDDEEISDGNHYLRHLEMTVEGDNMLVCDSLNALTFESEEEARLIAEYVGGRVVKLEVEEL